MMCKFLLTICIQLYIFRKTVTSSYKIKSKLSFCCYDEQANMARSLSLNLALYKTFFTCHVFIRRLIVSFIFYYLPRNLIISCHCVVVFKTGSECAFLKELQR